MEPRNPTKKLIGSVEISRIEDNVLVRRPMYLGLHPSTISGSASVPTFQWKATDFFVERFANFADLIDRFPLWSARSIFNSAMTIHEDTLCLIELNTYETMVASLDAPVRVTEAA